MDGHPTLANGTLDLRCEPLLPECLPASCYAFARVRRAKPRHCCHGFGICLEPAADQPTGGAAFADFSAMPFRPMTNGHRQAWARPSIDVLIVSAVAAVVRRATRQLRGRRNFMGVGVQSTAYAWYGKNQALV